MKVGDLVRFKQEPELDKIFGPSPKDIKGIVDIHEPRYDYAEAKYSAYAIIYYLQGPRAGQKSPCEIDRLEVVSESR